MEYSLKDLIKEKLLLFEGRVEDALEKYNEVPIDISDIFVENDPSGNHKYIDWLMKRWENDRCKGSHSVYIKSRCNNTVEAKSIIEDIKFFNDSSHKYPSKDINYWITLDSFRSDSGDAKLKLTKGELKKQATKHYETDRYLIVEPHSHPASCFYGGGTQWCTTSRHHDGHFNNYYKNSSLLYFINKKTGKKRAFLTRLGKPMFGPSRYGEINWVYAGDREYRNYSGEIYTETDRQGRSFAGIPIEAREAMQEAHKEKTKKWVKSLENIEDKAKIMYDLGMENIPVITTLRQFNSSENRPPPPEVTTIVTMDVKDDQYGNVKTVNSLKLGTGCRVVNSIEVVSDSLEVGTPNWGGYTESAMQSIDLGSIGGEIRLVTAYSPVSNWGNIEKINTLQVRNPYILNDPRLLKQIEINEIIISNNIAKEMLKNILDKDNVTISNW